MKLERTVAPSPLITVAEAKIHLRVVHTSDDAYIESLVHAATDFVEGYYGAGLAIGQQTWQLHLDGFPNVLRIPIWPVQSVSAITYRDAGGVEQTLTDFDADAKGNPATITPLPGASFPQTDGRFNSVTVEFVAGFAAIPRDIIQALLLLVGHWYENREAVLTGSIQAPYRLAFEDIMNQYAVRGFA